MADAGYDAASALAAFHDSRAGVRGLVESGVTAVPRIFQMPATASPWSSSPAAFAIPAVDLSLPRSDAVELIRAAATSLGFFHVTNHGVPAGTVDSAVAAVRAFHEQPAAARSALYSTASTGAAYYTTIPHLPPQRGHPSALPLMPWRDSLFVPSRFDDGGESAAEPDNLPPVCRDALRVFHRSLTRFGKEMTALLSEALGLPAERLEQALPVEGSLMLCHYYPPCPEPQRVVGTREHTDGCMFTLLTEDDGVGGLQVRLDQGDDSAGDGEWVDVAPVTGSLLVVLGDALKVVSNDEYKSVEHRVVIKSPQDARVSIANFFELVKCGESDFFGPLSELVTEWRPAHYRSLTVPQLMKYRTELGHARPSLDRFKIVSDNYCI